MKRAKEIMEDMWRRAKNTTKKERWSIGLDLLILIFWIKCPTECIWLNFTMVSFGAILLIMDIVPAMYKEEMKKIRGEE